MDFILILIVIGTISIFYVIVGAIKSRAHARLHDAVASDKYEKTLQLINEGKDVNAVSPRHDIFGGWTPLHQVKSVGIAKLLIDSGADVNGLSEHGWSPLFLKCKTYKGKRAELGVIELLINKGAKRGVSHDKDDPKTIESTLKQTGRTDLIEKLLENESEGLDRTPLHIAAGLGDTQKVINCLKRGDDVNARDKQGITPILMALLENQQEVVELLLQQDVDLNITDKDGTPPLSVAAGLGNAPIVKMMISKGSKIDHQEKDGWSPMHYACHRGHSEIAKILLENGADPGLKDVKGLTPSDYAANEGFSDIKAIVKKFAPFKLG